MTKIQQIDWSKLKPSLPERRATHGADPDALYWRYKKNEPPKDSSAVSNLPHPFKCSRCSYVAKSKTDFNEHWSLEH